MSIQYETVKKELRSSPARWLVTGGAGFIGSNIAETLLNLGQEVVVLDNLAAGYLANLDAVKTSVGAEKAARLQFIEGDIRNPDLCAKACVGAKYVLHQGALGSVPMSMENPVDFHEVNSGGTLNVFLAARDAGIKRVVYASSSAVYGNEPTIPAVEEKIGKPLSPYAATKYVDEVYGATMFQAYGLETIGLRYFNVFGPRQDPEGAYAAVIPRWAAAMVGGEPVRINGDGSITRDFCHVKNVVQANILAATTTNQEAVNRPYNVACGERITLNDLFHTMRDAFLADDSTMQIDDPIYQDFRAGDIMHSMADISAARDLIGFEPDPLLKDGIPMALAYYKSLS